MTSATANKLLKTLNERVTHLYQVESNCMTYTAIQGIDPIVPEYDINAVREEISTLNGRIVTLKHEINKFNVETVIPSLGLTIDAVLVQMKQLTTEKNRLDSMRSNQPKTINSSYVSRSTNNQVEYRVANYDPKVAEKMYQEVSEQLTRLQLELDLCNNTIEFEVSDAGE